MSALLSITSYKALLCQVINNSTSCYIQMPKPYRIISCPRMKPVVTAVRRHTLVTFHELRPVVMLASRTGEFSC